MPRQVRNLEGMTVAASLFRFEDFYARAVPGLSVPWTADSAPAAVLLVLNEELAVELGADPAALGEPRASPCWLGRSAPEHGLDDTEGLPPAWRVLPSGR